MFNQLHGLRRRDVSIKMRRWGKKTNAVVGDLVKLGMVLLIFAFVATLQIQHSYQPSAASTVTLCHSAKGINYFCLNPNKSRVF